MKKEAPQPKEKTLKEKKKKQQAEESSEDEKAKSRPDLISTGPGKGEGEEDELTGQRIGRMLGLVSQFNEPFDLMRLMVDPSDPVQTIENLFDFSFLIKTKRASLSFSAPSLSASPTPSSSETLPLALPLACEASPDLLEGVERRQMVLKLPMKDLALLSQGYARLNEMREEEEKKDLRAHLASLSQTLSLPTPSQDFGRVSRQEHEEEESRQGQGMEGVRRVCPQFLSPLPSLLHREHPLYHTQNAHEQAELILRMDQQRRRRSSGGGGKGREEEALDSERTSLRGKEQEDVEDEEQTRKPSRRVIKKSTKKKEKELIDTDDDDLEEVEHHSKKKRSSS